MYRLWASVRLAHLQDWFYYWVLDSVFSAGTGYLIGTFLTVPWGDLAFLPGFVRFTSLFTGKFGYGLSLLLVWGVAWTPDGGISPKVAHSVWFS